MGVLNVYVSIQYDLVLVILDMLIKVRLGFTGGYDGKAL